MVGLELFFCGLPIKKNLRPVLGVNDSETPAKKKTTPMIAWSVFIWSGVLDVLAQCWGWGDSNHTLNHLWIHEACLHTFWTTWCWKMHPFVDDKRWGFPLVRFPMISMRKDPKGWCPRTWPKCPTKFYKAWIQLGLGIPGDTVSIAKQYRTASQPILNQWWPLASRRGQLTCITWVPLNGTKTTQTINGHLSRGWLTRYPMVYLFLENAKSVLTCR